MGIDLGRRRMVGRVIRLALHGNVALDISANERRTLDWLGNVLVELPGNDQALAVGQFAAFGALQTRELADEVGEADAAAVLFRLAHIACGACDEASVDGALDRLDTIMGGGK